MVPSSHGEGAQRNAWAHGVASNVATFAARIMRRMSGCKALYKYFFFIVNSNWRGMPMGSESPDSGSRLLGPILQSLRHEPGNGSPSCSSVSAADIHPLLVRPARTRACFSSSIRTDGGQLLVFPGRSNGGGPPRPRRSPRLHTRGLRLQVRARGTLHCHAMPRVLLRSRPACPADCHISDPLSCFLGADGDTLGTISRDEVVKAEGAGAGGGEEGGGGKGAGVATGAEGGFSTSVEMLQQMVSVLQKEKEEAQAMLEQVQVQSKVDINWYESQLQALEHDSLQLSIATSKVRMLLSESEAAQAQGKCEVDAIRQELDAAQAALLDEQQARSKQQKQFNDLKRLMTEKEEMAEKYKAQISLLETTLKVYIDEQFFSAGKSNNLLTPSPESIHTRGLSALAHSAPGQRGRGRGSEDASGVDESGKIVPCRSAEAGKDCGVQCSLDTAPLDSEVELRLKHLEEQNSTLRQTVKDANGIIVKSEALTHDYRCKVLDLTRQLSEAQARLDDMERDANTTLATSPSQHETRRHLASTAVHHQRVPIKEEADGRRRDSSPLSWAAAAASSRLPMSTDPLCTTRHRSRGEGRRGRCGRDDERRERRTAHRAFHGPASGQERWG